MSNRTRIWVLGQSMDEEEIDRTIDATLKGLTQDGFAAVPGDDVTSQSPTGMSRTVRVQNPRGTIVTITVSTE